MRNLIPAITHEHMKAISDTTLELIPAKERFLNRSIQQINERLTQLANNFGLCRNFEFTVALKGDVGHILNDIREHFLAAGWGEFTILECGSQTHDGEEHTLLHCRMRVKD